MFTTRHRGLERLGEVVDLPPLSVQAGVALLLRGYHAVNIEAHLDAGTRIVNRLGGLALAIDQAAAYLQYVELPIGQLDEFLTTYEAERKKILRHIPEDLWEYRFAGIDQDARDTGISAFTTWEMSLQHLYPDVSDEREAWSHVLTLSAFLAPVAISETLFRNYWELASPRPQWMYIFNVSEDSEPDDERSLPHPRIQCWRLTTR